MTPSKPKIKILKALSVHEGAYNPPNFLFFWVYKCWDVQCIHLDRGKLLHYS